MAWLRLLLRLHWKPLVPQRDDRRTTATSILLSQPPSFGRTRFSQSVYDVAKLSHDGIYSIQACRLGAMHTRGWEKREEGALALCSRLPL